MVGGTLIISGMLVIAWSNHFQSNQRAREGSDKDSTGNRSSSRYRGLKEAEANEEVGMEGNGGQCSQIAPIAMGDVAAVQAEDSGTEEEDDIEISLSMLETET